MKKIKFIINDYSFFEIDYTFNISKYVNGDVQVKFWFQKKILYVYETQIKYFVELLNNLIDGLLTGDKKMECGLSENLTEEYVFDMFSETSREDNIQWKVLLDYQNNDENKGIGSLVFLFAQEGNFYIEFQNIDVKAFVAFPVRFAPELILRQKICIERIKEWKKIADEIGREIGSKIKKV